MTRTEAAKLVRAFARAASDLSDAWEQHATNPRPDEIDDLLTSTYPKDAIPMSFDEFAMELWAWDERVQTEIRS